MEDARKALIKKRLVELYRDADIASKMYLRIRFALAPFFEMTERIGKTEGTIYELGCGIGILSNLLSFTHPEAKIVGIDNSGKINIAKMAGRGKADFIKADILNFTYERAGAFIMMDILHHITFGDQEIILDKIYGALTPGGRLYINDVDTKPALKYGISRLADWLSGSKTYHRRMDDIGSLLKKHRFVIEEENRMDTGRIVSHIFIKCKK